MSGGKVVACGECGMPCEPAEYHPYAACLMFKGCHNSATVRANLAPLAAAIARAEAAEAKLAAIDALPVETITQMKGVGAGSIPYSWDDPAFDHCYARIVPCDKQGVTLMSSRIDAAIAAQQAEGE